MRALISFRRGVELEFGRGFHIGVAPSWHPDADFTSAWRLTGIQAQIQHRHGVELATERRFCFGVAPSWNPNADFTSAWR